LLFGNHEYHYLRGTKERCSGFQSYHRFDIQEQIHFALNKDLMQMCFIHQNYVFTHAGISKTWLAANNYDNTTQLDVFINNLFKRAPLSFRFNKNSSGGIYGNNIEQSPIWIRPIALSANSIDNYTQIVGHTQQPHITFLNPNIFLIDTLNTSREYVIIENNNLQTLSS
jgi:hypothetical protein